MTSEMKNIRIETNSEKSSILYFTCSVCEWVFNGSKDDFNNLPVEYNCIKCGATKVNFKQKKMNKNICRF